MTKSNKNCSQLQLIKKNIKDLSFENPQSISLINKEDSSEDIKVDFRVMSKPSDEDHIEVTLQIKCHCTHNEKILFCLELDYLGFFKKLSDINFADDTVIKEAVDLLFPSAKSIIHDITKQGGFITISLNDFDLNHIKKN